MLTPAYKLTIGGRVVDTTDEPQASTLVDLSVALDLDTPVDSFTLVLGQVGGLVPTREDEATIKLGYADNGGLTQVFSGTVVAVEPGLTRTRIVGHSPAAQLLRTCVDETFEAKTAGAIVRDLASRAGVAVATAEDGSTFPAYVIDGRRNIQCHLCDLAELCGFDFYINADGELIFAKFINGNTVHTFEYARHILALDLVQTPLRAEAVEAWGESPGGSQAEEAWAWLTKDFAASKGGAGSGEVKLLLERPALRTADAAKGAAEAALTHIQRRALRGSLLVPGQPQVKLGDAIRLRGVPDERLNGTFQVRSVTHRITKRSGFTTRIGFRSMEG